MSDKFCDDTLVAIMDYLTSRDVIASCMRVSRQFHEVACSRSRLALTTSDTSRWINTLVQESKKGTGWFSQLPVLHLPLGNFLPTRWSLSGFSASECEVSNEWEMRDHSAKRAPVRSNLSANITSLDFTSLHIERGFFKLIAECAMGNLRRVSLSSCTGPGRSEMMHLIDSYPLEYLDLSHCVEGVKLIDQHKIMTHLTYLDISQNHLYTIPKPPHSERSSLRTLNVSGNCLLDDTFCEWVESTLDDSLLELDASRNRLTALSVTALCSRERKLLSLLLDWNNISVEGVSLIASRVSLPELRQLSVSCGGVSHLHVKPLFFNPGKVEVLVLTDCVVPHEYAHALSQCENSITKLILVDCRLTPQSASSLLGVGPHLNHLTINGSILCGSLLRESIESGSLRGVSKLFLQNNNIGSEGLIAVSSHLKNLRVLSLCSNSIDDDGMIALALSECVTTLTWLDISHNLITYKGVVAFVTSPNAIFLSYLGLSCRSVCDKAALSISQTPFLKSLVTLNISESAITTEGVTMIRSNKFMPTLDAIHR